MIEKINLVKEIIIITNLKPSILLLTEKKVKGKCMVWMFIIDLFGGQKIKKILIHLTFVDTNICSACACACVIPTNQPSSTTSSSPLFVFVFHYSILFNQKNEKIQSFTRKIRFIFFWQWWWDMIFVYYLFCMYVCVCIKKVYTQQQQKKL